MNEEKISLDFSLPKVLLIRLSGNWHISQGIPSAREVAGQIAVHSEIKRIDLDASMIKQGDSGLVSFIFHLAREAKHKEIELNYGNLPVGVKKFLDLATKVDEREKPEVKTEETLLVRIGDRSLTIIETATFLLNFLGEVAVGLFRLFRGKSYFRIEEFHALLQRCGSSALPLITLISMLVGIIFAFIGAIQLKMFGAQIFVADIVAIAMVRVMGAVMAGILMSGRTGASFAAELGIMQVNDEIDALKTIGISPVEYLVVPRLLALVIMMPLLTIYANFMGILGGFAISTGLLGLNPTEYWDHTASAVRLTHLWIGLIHSFVFGIIISIAGCMRGIRCARSASAVGESTTLAVVESITSIVIATAIITFVCQVLGV